MKRSVMEPLVFTLIFLAVGALLVIPMGMANLFSTIMNTAYELLIKTTFYMMAVAVVMGAVSTLFLEFGIVNVLNKLLSPLMRPFYGLPGAASLGIVSTYLSDNPAILTLADNLEYRSYFKRYQFPALTNLGTSFGMGLIITTYMIGLSGVAGQNLTGAALVGNLGAFVGSIVSTRLMLYFSSRSMGVAMRLDKKASLRPGLESKLESELDATFKEEMKNKVMHSVGNRFMDAVLKGGKSGVTLGLNVIPGVLVFSTLIMLFTNGPSPDGSYTGAAFEGVALFPLIAEKLNFILAPLFGFSHPNGIAIPLTSLGAAGAAIGLIPRLLETGMARANDIAVFTAMCMCWSGYLSTHVAMMDSLNHKELTGKAIAAHSVGGLVAGMAAHLFYRLFF